MDELFPGLHHEAINLEEKVQGIEFGSVVPAPSTEIETESGSVAVDSVPFPSGAYGR